MLTRPQLGIAGLAEHLGWSTDQVRGALDELAKLSLVRQSDQQPGGLLLVNPEVSLVSLLARQEAELTQRQREITSGRLAISEIVAEYADAVHHQRRLDVEELTGIDMVRVRLEELAHSCTSEIMEFATGGGQSAASREASRPIDRGLLERGVHMRCVYLESVSNHPQTVSYLGWLSGLGCRVRVVPALPLRMVVFDRQSAIVPSNPDNTAVGALLLRGSGLISALCALFEHIWEDAPPFGSAPQRDDSTGLSSQARAVLSLLAQGHTDDVVARKLGISVRTSRRITADLMALLGARSRFQAGVIAGERGWLQGAQDSPSPN
ncbi:helix-turn-helix transcriptional regulator [Streptomyces sp. H27-D2]|uniref:helix-turn-helix transcriptional regulator n=1 Tax=Streptomyces sp. H27-D2 TaxID=3046304 RepID=UPI002DBD1D63|nr:helix-turn-helix transcriptional regulator [Streptomyces sp. H27-D2]MEC4020711.1 helix-turn-helix transcriptional regulator [Streptomyces sp. H27-D2]